MNQFLKFVRASISTIHPEHLVTVRSFSHLTKINNILPNNIRYKYLCRCNFHNFFDYLDSLSKPFNNNVLKLSNYDEYHDIVYRPLENDKVNMNDLVVSFFFNRQSTASLSVLDSVNKLSSEFPLNKILLVDSDVVPRSAYDADVQHFPSALLSYGGDLYRDLVSEEPGYNDNNRYFYGWSFSEGSDPDSQYKFQCVLPNKFYQSVLNAMKKFSSYDGRKVSSIKSRAGTHTYTHGIDTDNLNLKRVGWPTE